MSIVNREVPWKWFVAGGGEIPAAMSGTMVLVALMLLLAHGCVRKSAIYTGMVGCWMQVT